jgi:hypothetical protein
MKFATLFAHSAYVMMIVFQIQIDPKLAGSTTISNIFGTSGGATTRRGLPEASKPTAKIATGCGSRHV